MMLGSRPVRLSKPGGSDAGGQPGAPLPEVIRVPGHRRAFKLIAKCPCYRGSHVSVEAATTSLVTIRSASQTVLRSILGKAERSHQRVL